MDQQSSPLAEHQRFLATLRARLHTQTLWLRLATLAGVSAWVMVHGQSTEARYLFAAPMLALAGGALEIGLVRRDLLLAALARLPTVMVDLDLVEAQVPWRRALLRSAMPTLYVPTAALAAAITIDTVGAAPGWTVQTIWMLALGLSVVAAYTAMLGAWWIDRFGEQPPPVNVQSLRGAVPMMAAPAVAAPAVAAPFAPAVVAAAASAVDANVGRTPSMVPAEVTPGPFPVKRPDTTTQSFGTPVS